MNLLWILRGWAAAVVAWIREPSADAVTRAERDRKAQRLKAANEVLRGR